MKAWTAARSVSCSMPRSCSRVAFTGDLRRPTEFLVWKPRKSGWLDREGKAARIDRAVARGAARSPPRSVSLNGRIGVAPDGWPVAGQRLRDILVNAAQLGAGSVQVGVVLVGRAQCIVQRIGHGRAGAAHKHRYA